MEEFDRIKAALLDEAKNYTEAHHKRNERFKAWTTEGKADFVKETLEKIKAELINASPFFASNLYVDESHATMKTEGVSEALYSKALRTIILRSGIILVAGFTTENEKSMSSMMEKGFKILFNPMLNGKIHVISFGHSTSEETPKGSSIAVIDHPKDLTEQLIWQLVLEGLRVIKSTSYLFI